MVEVEERVVYELYDGIVDIYITTNIAVGTFNTSDKHPLVI
jgi:hypothetical protein